MFHLPGIHLGTGSFGMSFGEYLPKLLETRSWNPFLKIFALKPHLCLCKKTCRVIISEIIKFSWNSESLLAVKLCFLCLKFHVYLNCNLIRLVGFCWCHSLLHLCYLLYCFYLLPSLQQCNDTFSYQIDLQLKSNFKTETIQTCRLEEYPGKKKRFHVQDKPPAKSINKGFFTQEVNDPIYSVVV